MTDKEYFEMEAPVSCTACPFQGDVNHDWGCTLGNFNMPYNNEDGDILFKHRHKNCPLNIYKKRGDN